MAEETTASAEGNASAQLYVRVTSSPNETPFKTELTREEEDRHFYFNDDILELAERIDRLMAENADIQNLSISHIDEQIEAEQRNGTVRRISNLTTIRNDMISIISGNERRILALEQRILDELQTVRDEYRTLAENLNDGRELYTQDYELNERYNERRREELRRDNEDALQAGVDPAYLKNPETLRDDPNGPYTVHIDRYEKTYADYRFLEEGVAITTTREALMSFVWGGVTLIAVEIVTAGIAKYVAIGARILSATRVGRAATGVAARATAIIMQRYNALSLAAKARLDRLRITRRVDDTYRPPRNGTATDGRPPNRPANGRGTCALC